ncbi:MAG TPA: FAD-dependent monooxygenase [Kofleriaceae bacterium]|nr:FAD-dependent monooxygenase [Kofleriaceae bacterium]
MKIACIGGGPAGLYLGILVKRRAPEHEVVIFERNRPADTFGFGVVFSDATLGHLAAADPETHAQITSRFARWDDIEVQFGGEVLRSTGHGFCGLERKALLQILQVRAQELGVRIEFEREIRSLAEVSAGYAPDVIVACDGVASWVRDALAAELLPQVDVRPNKFVWLGCTVPYQAFTFVFKHTPHGMFRVHAYRYHEHGSTFIVECREDTWRRAGLATADEEQTVAILEEIFADELAGHRLIKNRSIWRNFPTVRCGKWHAGNVVLLGDAAHTAHFSIGSGTKLAMEDAIVLGDELLGTQEVGAALAAYEARRRPEVLALQAAAQASLEWFEGTERYARMAPVQFTYSLMTRSLRVSHASVGKRDPHLARGVEHLLAAAVGVAGDPPPPPSALPFALGDRRARSRIAVCPQRSDGAPYAPSDTRPRGNAGAPHTPDMASPRGAAGEPSPPDAGFDHLLVVLGGAALAGAGLVVTAGLPLDRTGRRPPGLGDDDQAALWRRIVDYVHGWGALIVARLDLSRTPPGALTAGIARAAVAGFDVVLLDPCSDAEATEGLPAAIAAARGAWRTGGWIAAAIHDRPAARAQVIGHAAQVVRAGADLLWVSAPSGSPGTHDARLPAAPLADRLRNEFEVATAIESSDARLADLEAAIAAGRADLVVVDRLPDATPPSP